MIQDSLGRSYDDGNKPSMDYLLKSGKPTAFAHPQAEKFDTPVDKLSAAIEPLQEDLKELFHEEYEHDKEFAKQVVDKLEEIRLHIATPKESKNTFGKMQSGESVDYTRNFDMMRKVMDKEFGLTKQFVDKACHPGSIYTHDIYIVQQMYRTNQLLTALVKNQQKASGKLESIGDIRYNKDADTFVSSSASVSDWEKELSKDLLNRINEITGVIPSPHSPATATGGASGGNGGGNRNTDYGEYAAHQRKMPWEHAFDAFRNDTRRELTRLAIKSSGALLGGKPIVNMAEGIGQGIEFQQSIRELAYQTERITKQMRRSQDEFMARDELTQAGNIAGKSLGEMQKMYVKNLAVGYKNQKDTLRVTRAGAALSTMIGSETESTTTAFSEMYMKLNASAATMEDISRSVQRTAVSSKITGEGLVRAVSAAQPLLDSLRAQGKLNSRGAGNAIGLTAEAQKRGLEGEFAPFFQGLTGINKIMKASWEVQNTLFTLAQGNAKLTDRMKSGEAISSPKDLAALAKGGDAIIQQLTGRADLNINNIKAAAALDSRLSEQVNIGINQGYGFEGIDSFVQFIETLRVRGKTLVDSIGELDSRLSKTNLTRRERNDLIDQKKSLVQENRLSIATQMDEISKLANPGETINALMSRIQGTKPFMEMTEDLRGLADIGQLSGFKSGDISSPESVMKALSQSYVQAIERTNEQLRQNSNLADDSLIVKNPLQAVAEAMKDQTGGGMRELLESMSKAQEAASRRDLKEVDPIVASRDTLITISNQFAKYAGQSIDLLTSILGELGIIALALGAWIGSLTVGLGGFDTIKGFFGKKGGARAADAAGGVRGKVTQALSNMMPALSAEVVEAINGVKIGVRDGFKKFGTDAVKLIGKSPLLNSKASKAFMNFVKSGTIQERMAIGANFVADVADSGADLAKKMFNFMTDPASDLGKKVRAAGSSMQTFSADAIQFAKSTGDDAKKIWKSVAGGAVGQAVANKFTAAKGVGNVITESIGSFVKAARGKMSIGESVFRAAEAQENIPIWGRFAKMFGAGDEIAASKSGLLGKFGAFAKHINPSTATVGANAGIMEIGAVATKAALPLLVFTTAMSAMSQGLETATNSARIFGVEQSKVTGTMNMAAESAGFLTGILNSLTFGIFDYWIGANGDLTASLANLFKWIPLLGYAVQLLMLPVKLVYGVISGLWAGIKEIGKGAIAGLAEIAKPFVETWDYLKGVVSGVMVELSDILKPLEEGFKALFGEGASSITIIGVLTAALKGLGIVIGGVLKGIGMFIGNILRVVLPVVRILIDVLAALASTIIKFVAPFVEALGSVLMGVGKVVHGVIDVFKGIFNLDWSMIGDGLAKAGFGILNIFSGIVEGAAAYLFGLPALVPAAIANMTGAFFSGLARWGKHIGKIFGPIGEMIMDYVVLPFEAIGKLFSGVGNGITWLVKLFSLLTKGDFSGIWKEFDSAAKTAFSLIPTWIGRGLMSIPGMIAQVFIDALSAVNRWMEANVPGYKLAKGVAGTAMKAGAEVITGHPLKAAGTVASAVAPVGTAAVAKAYQENGMWGATKAVAKGTAQNIYGAGVATKNGLVSAGKWLYNNTIGWIPGFAKGGLITKGGLAQVGEEGPELIIPVDDLQKTFVDGAAQSRAIQGDSVIQPYVDAINSMQAANIAESDKSNLQPLPLSDIHERIQQSFATSEPMNANVSSKELTDMVGYAEKEVNELQELKAIMKEILQALKPGNGSNLTGFSNSGTGQTRSRLKGPAATQYYNLAFGRFGDTANKGTVNDGVS